MTIIIMMMMMIIIIRKRRSSSSNSSSLLVYCLFSFSVSWTFVIFFCATQFCKGYNANWSFHSFYISILLKTEFPILAVC